MAKRERDAAKQPYLTKRRLVRAATSGIRKAAAETMAVMGYTVIADGGWVVKKYADGRIEKLSPIDTANTNGALALD